MLKKVNNFDMTGASCAIADAAFPEPFPSGLEFGAPARGVWNIVHTGMLVPDAHEIFVCAEGCLRGVVLTAAEMGASERFSTVEIRENNILDGDMDELLIDGVADVLNKLPRLPRAALVYSSCIHHFMATDLARAYSELRRHFPNVDFVDCYMTPTMRKSGLAPDPMMRRQLYAPLRNVPKDSRSVNIIGNDLATDASSELAYLVRSNGFTLRDITNCNNYDEYLDMAKSFLNIVTHPAALPAARELESRIGQRYVYAPLCYGFDAIRDSLAAVADALGAKLPDYASGRARAEAALREARDVVGDAPVELDYTVTPKPLSLARLLAEHGFKLTNLYVDSFSPEERGDFDWLRENRQELRITATTRPKLRVAPRGSDEKTLAIGQKSAFFTGSDNFVNVVEGGGMYGYDGVARLAELMTDAWLRPRPARDLIIAKGLGCDCLL